MSETEEARYNKRLHQLVLKERIAKTAGLDRWHLPPVGAGWLRGSVANLRQTEELCEFGTLQILEFDLMTGPKEAGVPVRMDGTYFTNRLIEGQVMDVPDPDPERRPVTPRQIFYSHSHRQEGMKSYYPGRDAMTKTRGALLGLLAVGGPILALVASLLLLHFTFHFF
jgi:hypothetical protein